MLRTGRTSRRRVGARALLALAIAASPIAGLFAQQPPPVVQTPSTALGAVSGVITDPAPLRPISGVNVQLSPPTPPGSARLSSTFTDDRGRFVFTNVAAGTYFLNA